MRCAVLYGKGDLRVEEWENPRPAAGEVVVKVSVCGVCHTDVAILDGTWPVPTLPFIIGHEYAGTVVEVGEGVSTLRTGDRVTAIPVVSCGRCSPCRRGLPHLCVARRSISGGFAEYVRLPERVAFKLPAGVSDLAGSMAEPVGVCLHAVEQGEVKPGDVALVVGGGPIGLTLVQMARLAGAATVILSEPNPSRRELGRKVGADIVVDPLHQNLAAIVQEATDGVGVDCALEAAGLPQTVELCLPLVRKGGTVVVVSVCAPDAVARFSPFDLLCREVTLRGTIGTGESFERAVRLLPSLTLEPLFSHEFKLEDIRQAVDHRRSVEGLKAYVRM